MKIAVISDVHGNVWALEAVLRDIRSRGADQIINLGDSLYGPLAPRETAALLRDPGILSVKGDSDRLLLSEAMDGQADMTAAFARAQIDGTTVRWLRFLHGIEIFEKDVLACHGCLDSDEISLFERVSAFSVGLRSSWDLLRHIWVTKQRLILCGHSHVFRSIVLADGTTIVNPGSVGLQACRLEKPYAHLMASGSPEARYALITSRGEGFDVEAVAIRYEWETAAATAFANGRPDWAVWLRTGQA